MIEQISIYTPPGEERVSGTAAVCSEEPTNRALKSSRMERMIARERYKRSLCAQARAQRIMFAACRISQSSPNLF